MVKKASDHANLDLTQTAWIVRSNSRINKIMMKPCSALLRKTLRIGSPFLQSKNRRKKPLHKKRRLYKKSLLVRI